MIKTFKSKKVGKQVELEIDWSIKHVKYTFTALPQTPKPTGGNMKLTADDINAIRDVMRPDFVALEARLTKKINDIETNITNRLDNIVSKNNLTE